MPSIVIGPETEGHSVRNLSFRPKALPGVRPARLGQFVATIKVM